MFLPFSIRSEIQTSSPFQDLLQRIQKGSEGPQWDYVDGLIRYKGKIFLIGESKLIPLILAGIHNQTHEGAQKTLFRLSREFFGRECARMSMISYETALHVNAAKEKIYTQ